MPKLIQCLSKEVERRRNQRELSQEELGRLVGVSEQTIWNIENQKKGVGFDTINKLAQVFDCEETDLVKPPDRISSHSFQDCLEVVTRAALRGSKTNLVLKEKDDETLVATEGEYVSPAGGHVPWISENQAQEKSSEDLDPELQEINSLLSSFNEGQRMQALAFLRGLAGLPPASSIREKKLK